MRRYKKSEKMSHLEKLSIIEQISSYRELESFNFCRIIRILPQFDKFMQNFNFGEKVQKLLELNLPGFLLASVSEIAFPPPLNKSN